MKNLSRFALTLIILLNYSLQINAQVFTNKEVGKKNAELIDSLKAADYPYSLPIWGDKATKAGYNLPYSAGISTQYFWQVSDLIIENLQVGFNGGTKYDLDDIVRFNKAEATASALTVRPDIWLFPFLNIYGIVGRTSASTEVGVGVWVPDSSGISHNIANFGSKIEFNATSFGLGMTPTIGIGGGFMALDMNVAWTDVPQLSKPAMSFVFGPRFGKAFKFKKEKTLAVWAGGFRVKINSGTDGSIPLSDAIDVSDWSNSIDQGMENLANTQEQVDAWWAGLTPAQQQNPVNKAKYEAANSALDKAGNVLNAADNAVNTIGNSTVEYSMDKRPKDMWNFIVGSQYQFNKHFMVRGEFGFLGSRTQFMTGVQYRFGL